jgi:NADPH:quinone reductase-like Zn-dependent oxidoreductase
MVGAPNDIPVTRLLARLIGAFLLSMFASRKMRFFIAKVNQEDLTILGEFMGTGKVTPVIDKHFRLSDVREAFRYAAEGHTRGKLIIIPDI